MKVKTILSLIDNRYRVDISVFDPSSLEQDALDNYGEPLVEVGGEITGSATREGESATNVTFTFPTEERQLISGFPLVKFFDFDDSADADVQAKVYADEIYSRIGAARTALLSSATNFLGETTLTL